MHAIVITLGCLLVSFIWNILFWNRSYGISVPIFTAIVVSFLLWVKSTSLSKTKLAFSVHIFILAYLSVCVVCYRNSLILYAAVPSVFLGLGAIVFAGRQGYSFSNWIGVTESLVKKTFGASFSAPGAVGKGLNKILRTSYLAAGFSRKRNCYSFYVVPFQRLSRQDSGEVFIGVTSGPSQDKTELRRYRCFYLPFDDKYSFSLFHYYSDRISFRGCKGNQGYIFHLCRICS